MAVALREQQNRRLVQLRRRQEEDMEVDAVSMAKPTKVATEASALEKIVARLEALEKNDKPKPTYRPDHSQQRPQTNWQKTKPPNNWTSDGRPICNHCNKIGHKWRECHMRSSSHQERRFNHPKN